MENKEIQRFRKRAGYGCGLAVATTFLAIGIPSCMAFNTWMDAETYDELLERGGIEVELEETLLSQLEEYATNGEVTSKLNFNIHCYTPEKTQFLESSNSFLNVARGKECDGFAFRDTVTPQSRGERVFIRDSSQRNGKQAIRISCEGIYRWGYEIATSDKTMPELSSGGGPSCPMQFKDANVDPDYEEYLLWEGEVIDPRAEIRKVAKNQIDEFFETRGISFKSSFRNACYESWTEISEDSGIATNFMMAKPCFGLSLQSYIKQIIPDESISYRYRDYAAKRWKSAHISVQEITCIGAYKFTHSQKPKIPKLSGRPPGQSVSYRGWCPNDRNGDVVSPEIKRHSSKLGDELIPDDLPVPPKRPNTLPVRYEQQ